MQFILLVATFAIISWSPGPTRADERSLPPRPQSPLLRYHGNGCQTLGPCVGVEKFALFAGLTLQANVAGANERREVAFGGQLAVGMDLIRRVALEASLPIAWVHDTDDQYLLTPGPVVIGGRVRLGRTAPTIFSPDHAPHVTGAVGAQVAFRLPRAEGDVRHVGALPLGVPQPTVFSVVEVRLGPVQIAPHVAIHGADHAAYIDLGGRVSTLLMDSLTVDVFAISKLLAQREPLVGRCPGGARGGIGLRSVVARGMLLSAQYSAGTGDCEATHAAMLGITFAFGGPELIRIPKPEEVKSISDFWKRVELSLVDPVLDCNGWLLSDDTLLPLFQIGDPDPYDSTLIHAGSETYHVGDHFDIDSHGHVYKRGLYHAPILGRRTFRHALIESRWRLPVCRQGPAHNLHGRCALLEHLLTKVADDITGSHYPPASPVGLLIYESEFERECLGGKNEEDQQQQILSLGSLLASLLKRGRGATGVGTRPVGMRPPGQVGGQQQVGANKTSAVGTGGGGPADGMNGMGLPPSKSPPPNTGKSIPKPTPNFEPPTNPPQLPPTDIPPGWRVREMPPTEQYPNGYWKLEKPMKDGGWQPIDPSTMKPGTRPQTHIPFPAKKPV